jgi:hypothetical protein
LSNPWNDAGDFGTTDFIDYGVEFDRPIELKKTYTVPIDPG